MGSIPISPIDGSICTTMEQNKSNFKDFVLIQQDENEDDDPLLKDRE